MLMLCLAGIFIQDFKFRKIHILLPIAVFILSFLIVGRTWHFTAKGLIYNLLFLFGTFGSMVLYMSLKNRKFLNPFSNYFGLGDLLMLSAVTPLFLLRNYVLFFIGAMIFSIVLHLAVARFREEKTVPLAGYASLFLILIIAKDTFLDYPGFTIIHS